MNSKAFQIYANNALNTASKGQILLALYDAAARYMLGLKDAIDNKDIINKGRLSNKAHAVFSLLQATLRDEISPELTKNLRQLYIYFSEKVFEASQTMHTQPVLDILPLWQQLSSAWNKAVLEVEGQGF